MHPEKDCLGLKVAHLRVQIFMDWHFEMMFDSTLQIFLFRSWCNWQERWHPMKQQSLCLGLVWKSLPIEFQHMLSLTSLRFWSTDRSKCTIPSWTHSLGGILARCPWCCLTCPYGWQELHNKSADESNDPTVVLETNPNNNAFLVSACLIWKEELDENFLIDRTFVEDLEHSAHFIPFCVLTSALLAPLAVLVRIYPAPYSQLVKGLQWHAGEILKSITLYVRNLAEKMWCAFLIDAGTPAAR